MREELDFRIPQDRQRRVAMWKEDGRVHESFQEACDINKIVKKFQKTNVFTHVNRAVPRYADVYNAAGLLGSFEAVELAREQFMSLPSEVRAVAGNDPVTFLAMLENPDQAEQLAEAGLVERREPVAPSPEVVTPEVVAPVAPVTEPS